MPENRAKDREDKDDKSKDIRDLAEFVDFLSSGDFKTLVENYVSSDAQKNLAGLQNMFANKVFDWNNDETKKPARDAFIKLTDGYDRLSKTFSPEQKVIAKDTDFKESVAALVLSMRDQMEHFKEDAKVQSRRFYVSTAIAVASIVVTAIIAVAAMLI